MKHLLLAFFLTTAAHGKQYCEWTRCEVDETGNRTDCRPHRGTLDADGFADRVYIPGLMRMVPRYDCWPLDQAVRAGKITHKQAKENR